MNKTPGLQEIRTFLKHSLPGAYYCYATAHNLQESIITRALQLETYRLATEGKVYLVQKRVSNMGLFDYFLIKASRDPVISLIPYTEEKLKEREGLTKCQLETA